MRGGIHGQSLLSCALPYALVQLSKECRDLIDRTLEVDEARRITISQITAHPWYNVPLSANYAAAEEQLRRDQAKLDSRRAMKRVDTVRPLYGRQTHPYDSDC